MNPEKSIRSALQNATHSLVDNFRPARPLGTTRIKFLVLTLTLLAVLASGGLLKKAFENPAQARNFVVSNQLLANAFSILLDANLPTRLFATHMEPVERLELDIKFRNLKKLAHARLDALDRGQINPNTNVFVKAVAHFRGVSNSVKIRYKGTNIEQHLGTDKPSYRVKIRGNGSIGNMRRFALMDPVRRGYLHSWVFRQALMRENIIAKRYILIDLWLNGSRHGIYFIDEHFDSFLAENNKRPDSVFLRFSAPWKVALEPPPNPTDDSAFFATEVVTYGRYERPSYTNLLAQATSRLNNFRYNKIPVSAVFDEKLFARYFALADVFGAWHGLSFANLRFYFNPITGLIEPVPDDNFNEVVTHVKKDRLTRLTDSYNRGALLKRFLADTSFVSMYIDEVRRFTDPQYLDRFFSSIAPNLEAYVNIIRKDHPLYDFRYRADRGGLIGILKNQGVGKSEVMFHADLIRDTVLSSIAKRLDSTTQAHLGEPIRKPLSSGPCNTKLNRTNLSLANPLIEFQDDRVVIPHGTFHIYKDFVVPDGCYLQVQAGANVVLHNGAYIVSSQRANFVGTAQAPISLRGTPPFGGGLLVLNSPLKSAIRYTHFSALSSGVSTDRFLRGAVTFYRSDVEITNSTFVGNLFGDDFLNIVDSNYSLASCHFDTTFSDAFDSDFSNGVIIDTRYTNIGADKTSGGDALDFSRSQALIQNAHFQTIGDKAISIGESSTVTVIDAVIHDATNGLVTKDGSSAVFTGVNFYGVQRGLVVFRKKPGYPTPMAVGENVSFSDVPLPFLVERNSTLTLDGEDIPYNTLDGKSIIYTRQ